MRRDCIIGPGLELFCLFFGFFGAANAQDIPHFVEKLTIGEGLSSNVITDLVQDEDGFLWIATPDGIDRWDGTEAVHYSHGSDSNSLPHSYVNCLVRLRGPMLAIGTQAGLSFYNTRTGVFQNFYSHHQPALDLYNNTIEELCVDAKGNCWAASRNCIYIFDQQNRLRKTIRSPFTETLAARERLSYVEKMLPQSNGDVLLFLHDGWAIYSAGADSLIHYHRPPAFLPVGDASLFPAKRLFPLYGKYLLSIAIGKDSLVLYNEQGREQSRCFFPYNKYPYISWSQRVVSLDSSTLLVLLHNYGLLIVKVEWSSGSPRLASLSPLLFEENEYQTALRDRQGNWWLATTKEGLQKIAPSRQYFTGTQLIDVRTSRPIRYEVTSCNRRGSTLWICTYGNGFFEQDLGTGRQVQHRLTGTGNDTWANFVWNCSFQGGDTLFLGTQAGLFAYDRRTRKIARLKGYSGKPSIADTVSITSQYTDSRGLIWMGLGKGNGLCVYDSRSHRFKWYPGCSEAGYPLRYPTGLAEDRQGNLWFTNDASSLLVRWDRRSGTFSKVGLPSVEERRTGPLRGICLEPDSILWLGDVTGGLLRYDWAKQTVSFYGRDNGLSNSHITDIYPDDRQRLWLITEGGLVCFDPATGLFVNFSTRDGLPVAYPSADFFFDAVDKRLYTGGRGSYFSFDPHAILPRAAAKKILITALQVNGVSRRPDSESPIILGSQQNDITVRYGVVDLVDGPSTNYVYRLIGADSMWMKAGKQRQIDFSHLPPGRYTFEVGTAKPESNKGAGVAKLAFIIKPPFMQTAVFYGLVFLVLAGGVAVFYGYRKRQLNRTRQIRSEISRNLHDEVGANLTNISLSSLVAQRQLDDAGAVSKMLDRIYQDSQLVSESMREIVWSINPEIDTLGEALPRMLHYASNLLESNGIELQATVDAGVERLRLTMAQRRDVYLILKESIHNMVRHSKATDATVRFDGVGRQLRMTITDNGIGCNGAAGGDGNGLRNMRERARQHHWKLEIGSGPRGTTIVLETA